MDWLNLAKNLEFSNNIDIDDSVSIIITSLEDLKNDDYSIPYYLITVEPKNYAKSELKIMQQFLSIMGFLNKDKNVFDIHLSINGYSDRCLGSNGNDWQYLTGQIKFKIN